MLTVESYKKTEQMLPEFQLQWSILDPDARGFLVDTIELELLLQRLPVPFGIGASQRASLRTKVEWICGEKNFDYSFKSVLSGIVKIGLYELGEVQIKDLHPVLATVPGTSADSGIDIDSRSSGYSTSVKASTRKDKVVPDPGPDQIISENVKPYSKNLERGKQVPRYKLPPLVRPHEPVSVDNFYVGSMQADSSIYPSTRPLPQIKDLRSVNGNAVYERISAKRFVISGPTATL